MNTLTVKILTIVISLLILISVISQIVISFSDKYVTETAVRYSSTETVRFQGVYVRDETVIENKPIGVVDYAVPDGGKVAADSVVARVYQSEETIAALRQIESLEKERDILTDAQNPGTTAFAQPDFISSLINDSYRSVLRGIASDNFTEVGDERVKLQTLTGIYKIVVKSETDYSSEIAAISAQISQLQSAASPPVETIISGGSGYFVSYTDGYEGFLTTENAGALSADLIKRIAAEKNSTKTDLYIGKIVADYRFKILGIISSDMPDFKSGGKITLQLDTLKQPIDVTIDEILPTENTNERLLILNCDEFGAELVARRTDNVELVINDYSGLKVPREALRFDENNERGVYILQGQKITFKKVDVIYESTDFILSSMMNDTSFLSEFDDIILSGNIDDSDILETTPKTAETAAGTTAETTDGTTAETTA
ncbi:MAG: hypothetical protein LBM87_00775 [Ruminococcus sp.]|jgi:hypothetical protein|nr:hypothetical protein [Ruminococcus sp.]